MKQTYLFFVVFMLLSISFACEQKPEEKQDPPIKKNIENEALDPTKKSNTTKIVTTSISNNFIASMRNLQAINTYIEGSNKQLVNSMELTVQTKTQYYPLSATALQIQTITEEFHQYILALKDLIAQESDGVYTQFDTKTKNNVDLIGMPKDGRNIQVVLDVFITGQYGGVNTQEQQGPVLYKKLNALMIDYMSAVGTLWNDGGIRGTIFADPTKQAQFLNNISEQMVLNTFNKNTTASNWVTKNFKNKTVENVYINLTELQNQVNLSEAAILKILSEQMGRLELTYDKFDVLARAPKSHVLLGESYEAEISLGAYSSQAKFAVSVGGRGLSVIDGKARYKTQTSRVGEQAYNAKISVINPQTGETETFTKTFRYEVVHPSISVAPDKQNILYIGVNNPVTIAAVGIPSSALKVSIAGATLKKHSSSGYTVQVLKPGEVVITVSDAQKGRSFPFQFIAKKIPNPVVRLGEQIDGRINASKFKLQTELKAVLENFEHEAKCIIQSYNLTYTRKRQDAVELKGKGRRFAGQVLSAIKQAKPGDQYVFTEVKARCPGDKAGRRINGLAFQIK